MTTEVLQGARTSFGPKVAEKTAPYTVADGVYKTLVVPINWDELPAVSADDATVQTLPAHAWIEKATLQVVEPFTSGGAATLTLGLAQPDGTAIDVDGIDVAIALSAINTKGQRVLCDGALVANTAGVGANEGQVVASTAVAALTGGKAFLIIDYYALNV